MKKIPKLSAEAVKENFNVEVVYAADGENERFVNLPSLMVPAGSDLHKAYLTAEMRDFSDTETGRHALIPLKTQYGRVYLRKFFFPNVCVDCGKPKPESYMLKNNVWLTIMPQDKGLLCIPCAEKRLGRPLARKDFMPGVPVNFRFFPPTKRDLINEAQKIEKYLGHFPSSDSFSDHSPFDDGTVYRLFGDWESFRRAAGGGAKKSPKGIVRVADAALFASLRRVIENLGRLPSINEFDELSGHASSTVTGRFGSYRQFVEAAGYKYVFRRFDKSDSALFVADVKKVADRLKYSPTQTEYAAHGAYAAATVRKYLDCATWRDVLKKVFHLNDDEARAAQHKTSRPPEDRLGELRELAKRLRRTPSAAEAKKRGIGVTTLTNRYGTWNAALAAAGLKPRARRIKTRRAAPDRLAELKKLADRLGRSPTMADARLHGIAVTGLVNSFGGWNKALSTAGLAVNRQTKK